jgi:hypothetical protein
MNEDALKVAVSLCALWGAVVSTVLAAVKFWETFWKDRIRLDSSHDFSSLAGAADTITIVNLSAVPVQVSHWTLAWKPTLLFRWNTPTLDVTPEDGTGMFTIPPKDSYTLEFPDEASPSGRSKFDWSYRSATHRQLLLTLHIFGRRPKVLKIHAGM